jgi:diazepam-binding inhibitor (GABA receptor modulating acyl-CoA-binding protein)
MTDVDDKKDIMTDVDDKKDILEKKFEKYSKKALKLENVSNEDKLFLYAHYKQATFGNNTNPKPFIVNLVESEKWKAWTLLNDMDKYKCIKLYIRKVKELYKN